MSCLVRAKRKRQVSVHPTPLYPPPSFFPLLLPPHVLLEPRSCANSTCCEAVLVTHHDLRGLWLSCAGLSEADARHDSILPSGSSALFDCFDLIVSVMPGR